LIPHSRPTTGGEEARAVAEVLNSRQVSMGKKTLQFENELSKFVGMKNTAMVSSGSNALQLALQGMEISENDEVIIPSFVCTALLNAVNLCGAKPVLVDCNYEDGNISFESARKAIGKNTKAIIVPHMFGQAADLKALLELGIPVIEDCAQAIGAEYAGKKVGGIGKASVFSFYATKMITCGEGGAIASNDGRILERARELRDYTTQDKKYFLAYNAKPSDLQAAMALMQLRNLPAFVEKRRQIAKKYLRELGKTGLELPEERHGRKHAWYRFVVKLESESKRNAFAKKMLEAGVQCGNGVKRPLHQMLGMSAKNFPNSEELSRKLCSIPIYPSLQEEEISRIIGAAKRAAVN